MKNIFETLIDSIKSKNRIYIQPHNMPDPDAIASSFGLRQLLRHFSIEAEIIYVSSIEKANSKTMVEMFNIDMAVKEKNFITDPLDYIILIDSQIGNSNITDFMGKNIAVIDHHKEATRQNYFFQDIRENVGACATIIASYYKEMNITPSKDTATALLYGIMTDTNNLTRTCDKMDLDYFYWLYNLADMQKMKKLRMNEIGREDLYAYVKALETFELHGHIGFVQIENCNDSLLGTISDMLFTVEGVTIVVSYARRSDGIKFSIRSGEENISANELIKFILNDYGIGGGHKEMAGGFIIEEEMMSLKDKELDTYVRYRTILYVESKIAS